MQKEILFYLLPLISVILGYTQIRKFESISMKWMGLYILYPVITYALTHSRGYNIYTLCISLITPLLITHIITDIKETELSDIISLTIFTIGLVNFGYYVFKGAPIKSMLIQYGIPALAMFGIYFIIAMVTKEALGGGDIKLVGALGLFIHIGVLGKFLVYPMLIGALIAIVFLLRGKKKDALFPFGPAIVVGFYLTFLI